MSDCTGCQNLSNPTHKRTREMCQIVQDVRTCLIPHTKGPGKCVRLYRMSDSTSSTVNCYLLLIILSSHSLNVSYFSLCKLSSVTKTFYILWYLPVNNICISFLSVFCKLLFKLKISDILKKPK